MFITSIQCHACGQNLIHLKLFSQCSKLFSIPPSPISRGKTFYNVGRGFLYSQLALFIKRTKEKTLLSKSYMLIVDIYLDWLVTSCLTFHSKYLLTVVGLRNLVLYRRRFSACGLWPRGVFVVPHPLWLTPPEIGLDWGNCNFLSSLNDMRTLTVYLHCIPGVTRWLWKTNGQTLIGELNGSFAWGEPKNDA